MEIVRREAFFFWTKTKRYRSTITNKVVAVSKKNSNSLLKSKTEQDSHYNELDLRPAFSLWKLWRWNGADSLRQAQRQTNCKSKHSSNGFYNDNTHTQVHDKLNSEAIWAYMYVAPTMTHSQFPVIMQRHSTRTLTRKPGPVVCNGPRYVHTDRLWRHALIRDPCVSFERALGSTQGLKLAK